MRLANLRAVLADGVLEDAYLDIYDGLIQDIGQGQAKADLDANNYLLLPGLIDLHGDMIERDVEPRPKAYFPTRLALFELDKRLASLGITTAYAAISFAETNKRQYLRSEERAKDTIHLIHNLKNELLVDKRIHARFEITNLEAPRILQELVRNEQLDMISINDHTPGQGQYRDLERHIQHVSAWRGVTEESFRKEVTKRLERLKENPPSWDVIRTICEEAQAQGIVLASHDDDTIEKVNLVAGLGVSISEFPVTLEAAHQAKRKGLYTIMGAPNAFRGQSNTGNLSAMDALSEGVLDILASDYYPAAMLHIIFKQSVLPLHEAVKLVSSNAAEAANLSDRGSLEVKKRADFVLLDDSGELPRVKATFAKGKLIYSDGSLAIPQAKPRKHLVCT